MLLVSVILQHANNWSSIIFLPANHTLLSLVSCMVNSYTSKFAMTVTAEISRTRLIRRIPSILDDTNVTAFPPAQHSHGFVVIYVVSYIVARYACCGSLTSYAQCVRTNINDKHSVSVTLFVFSGHI